MKRYGWTTISSDLTPILKFMSAPLVIEKRLNELQIQEVLAKHAFWSHM